MLVGTFELENKGLVLGKLNVLYLLCIHLTSFCFHALPKMHQLHAGLITLCRSATCRTQKNCAI